MAILAFQSIAIELDLNSAFSVRIIVSRVELLNLFSPISPSILVCTICVKDKYLILQGAQMCLSF